MYDLPYKSGFRISEFGIGKLVMREQTVLFRHAKVTGAVLKPAHTKSSFTIVNPVLPRVSRTALQR